MAFDWLKPKPATRITTAWGTALIDVLNLLYGWLTSGQQDINVDEVFANYGYFNYNVLVQGKPVIKDGDPISLYDIFDYAQSRITAAIDSSRYVQRLEDIYARFTQIYLDEYGRVGVAIYDDRAGLARESTLSAIAGALASRAADKLRVSVVDVLPESPLNLTKVAGAPLTARDWSSDLAKLQNIDVALSTRASESTLASVLEILRQQDLRCYDATVDTLYAVPEGTVWYAKNVYVTDGELYVDGEVKVCG
jgi:hypothetical protein